ncbi:hypothetical protein GCM10027418_08920 [Mariniluteicoccus endophyticus]
MTQPPDTPRIRRGTVDDAAELTRVLHVAQAYTYTPVMPVHFAIDRITEIPQAIEEQRAQMARDAATEAGGGEPFRRWWVAEDADGVMGVAGAGHGTCSWEGELAAPPTTYHLDKLYTLPRAHGSGVGHALLDAAVPADMPVYLWILAENPRAERFYRRNGFVEEGYAATTGPWGFEWPMFRMVRGL